MTHQHYIRYETRGDKPGHPFYGNGSSGGASGGQASGPVRRDDVSHLARPKADAPAPARSTIRVQDTTTKAVAPRSFDSETNGKPNQNHEVLHNGQVIGNVFQATVNMDRNIAGTRLRAPKPPAQKWKWQKAGGRESFDHVNSKSAAVEASVKDINP